MAEPTVMSEVFWQRLAEQGWFGILYAEEAGGSRLGLVDLTVLMEKMGRAAMHDLQPTAGPPSFFGHEKDRRADG
jgi:alkylation response protein AidB-like acyl-CoA dehydrogenase